MRWLEEIGVMGPKSYGTGGVGVAEGAGLVLVTWNTFMQPWIKRVHKLILGLGRRGATVLTDLSTLCYASREVGG